MMESSRQDSTFNFVSVLCTFNLPNLFQEYMFLIDFLGPFLRYSILPMGH